MNTIKFHVWFLFSFLLCAGSLCAQINNGGSGSGSGTSVGVWQRQGTVIVGSTTTDGNTLQESTILCDSNPVILTGSTQTLMCKDDTGNALTYTNAVYKIWHSCGWGTFSVCYAESYDGITWVRCNGSNGCTNPVIASHARSFVVKCNTAAPQNHTGCTTGTFYAFAMLNTGARIDLYTAIDGVTFSASTTGSVSTGAGGSWSANAVANASIFFDASAAFTGAGPWKMYYLGQKCGSPPCTGGAFYIGLATATNLTDVFTNYSSNPVVSSDATSPGGYGNPHVKKLGTNNYWMWAHSTVGATSLLPSDIYRYSSHDMVTWTQTPAAVPTAPRTTPDEGAGNAVGQIADAYLLEVVQPNGQSVTNMYVDASADGAHQAGLTHLKLLTANLSISQLVNTTEGVIPNGVGAGGGLVVKSLGIGVPAGNASSPVLDNALCVYGTNTNGSTTAGIPCLVAQAWNTNTTNFGANIGTNFYYQGGYGNGVTGVRQNASLGACTTQYSAGTANGSQGVNIFCHTIAGVQRYAWLSLMDSAGLMHSQFSNHVEQIDQTGTATTGQFAGHCSMSAGTSCTFSIASSFTSTPVCVAGVQSATVIAGSCTVSGTTVTITAASSNSSTWNAVLIGDPN